MPIYEYRAISQGCDYCRRRFEVRQGMNEAPLTVCPECGAPVRKLFSRPFISIMEPLSENEKLVKHAEAEADRLRLTDGFAADRIYQ